MSAICAGLGSKGKVGVQRGRETAGVPSFLPPRRAPRRSRRPQTANPHAEIQRKTSRPLGTNTPAAVRVPRLSGAEKEPPRQGEHANAVRVPRSAGAEKEPPVRANTLTQFAHPAQPVQKRSRPVRANTLTQFARPGQPVQEKEPPRQGEPANAVRAPRLSGAEKEPPVRANTLTQFAHPVGSVQKIREIPKKFSRPKRQQKRPFSR